MLIHDLQYLVAFPFLRTTCLHTRRRLPAQLEVTCWAFLGLQTMRARSRYAVLPRQGLFAVASAKSIARSFNFSQLQNRSTGFMSGDRLGTFHKVNFAALCAKEHTFTVRNPSLSERTCQGLAGATCFSDLIAETNLPAWTHFPHSNESSLFLRWKVTTENAGEMWNATFRSLAPHAPFTVLAKVQSVRRICGRHGKDGAVHGQGEFLPQLRHA